MMNNIVEKVENNERLQEFVYCLYNDKDYKLKKLKSLDFENKEIAFKILNEIYPENIFGNLERYKWNAGRCPLFL